MNNQNTKEIFFSAILPAVLVIFIIFIIIMPKVRENRERQPEFQSGDVVAWEQVDDILLKGNVEMVAQTHNLDVIITLDDGTVFNTKEPKIDDIFRKIEKCGQICDDIILATE